MACGPNPGSASSDTNAVAADEQGPKSSPASEKQPAAAKKDPAMPSSSPTPPPSKATDPVTDSTMMTIDWLPEMQADSRAPGNPAPALTEAELAAFASAWASAKPELTKAIDGEALRRLSRWAKPQMASYEPPVGWLDRLSMTPMAATADGMLVRFGQKPADGHILPSHSPLVFRYLLVAADYDRGSEQIGSVTVTIRGWVEE